MVYSSSVSPLTVDEPQRHKGHKERDFWDTGFAQMDTDKDFKSGYSLRDTRCWMPDKVDWFVKTIYY